ncbi:MAG: hypothetical protein KME31_34990 [Tolypothrix carrinoi HA7290-LM1]|jgi:hypothetical protein|nr:hypothetical protein [Tolypothrix carrinoi HA7290-LM1]
MEMDNPRQKARLAMKESVPASLWLENENFVANLRSSLKHHPVATHPVIAALNRGAFNREQMKRIHLEYRHAIVQIFTDALLMAQYQTHQLEQRLKPGSKMYARFLLTLNDLDEFGFQPGFDEYGYYRGNPYNAHYPLFERVLDELRISLEERQRYIPSKIAKQVRKCLEDTYNDLNLLTSLLAVAEQEVVLFSAPLRENIKAVGINVTSGYYVCHGTSDDVQAEANDDTHEDDLWYVLMQAITPAQYDDMTKLCHKYCDLWVEFWDAQMNLLTGFSSGKKTTMVA